MKIRRHPATIDVRAPTFSLRPLFLRLRLFLSRTAEVTPFRAASRSGYFSFGIFCCGHLRFVSLSAALIRLSSAAVLSPMTVAPLSSAPSGCIRSADGTTAVAHLPLGWHGAKGAVSHCRPHSDWAAAIEMLCKWHANETVRVGHSAPRSGRTNRGSSTFLNATAHGTAE
jgi:hypothetical protein